jgi:hypothetical protein
MQPTLQTRNFAADCFLPVRGEGRIASLPRFDPFRFSATHPSGMESPQRPRTLSKELRSDERYDFAPREKALTVARRWPEKRDAGKGRSKASGSGFSLCM